MRVRQRGRHHRRRRTGHHLRIGYVNVDATIFDAALATTCASGTRVPKGFLIPKDHLARVRQRGRHHLRRPKDHLMRVRQRKRHHLQRRAGHHLRIIRASSIADNFVIMWGEEA